MILARYKRRFLSGLPVAGPTQAQKVLPQVKYLLIPTHYEIEILGWYTYCTYVQYMYVHKTPRNNIVIHHHGATLSKLYKLCGKKIIFDYTTLHKVNTCTCTASS